ncbi:MAG: amidohydrolase family protein [Planctomycetota bacterium]
MNRPVFRVSACSALLLLPLAAPVSAQAARQAPPFLAIEGVEIGLESSDARSTLVLRDGRIQAILPADEEPPPGALVVDGSNWIALPAFIDAYTTEGVETPEPVIDRDQPLDVRADVRIDMRLANRKGLQPAFDAHAVATLEEGRLDAYRESGFGLALQAPSGQLLSGDSVLVALRDAALRDRIVVPEAFAHAAFRASGDGYPSTLMGYIAQYRQFFLDAERHGLLLARSAAGQPGPRPPYDADLEAGLGLLAGGRTVLAEANGAKDIQRYMRCAAEMGFQLGIVGGRSAHEVVDLLLESRIPVVMTLDFGDEPDDPRPDDEEGEESDADAGEGEGEASDEGASTPDDAAEVGDGEEDGEDADESGEDDAEEAEDSDRFVYREPYSVRLERRVDWESRRDGALRLAEAGVPFALGTDDAGPADLLERVRGLVERGLPESTALAALTSEPARLLGVEGRVGRLVEGADATLVLWTANPLTDEDASTAWVFVDGYGWENPELGEDE